MRVVFVEGSGSYGTNGADHAAADAVLLSKTIGKPVRVQWSRQDEHGWDPKGPQQLLDLRAGLDAAGRIVAWDTQMWIPANRRGARILLAAQSARHPPGQRPRRRRRSSRTAIRRTRRSRPGARALDAGHAAQPVEPARAREAGATCSPSRASPTRSPRRCAVDALEFRAVAPDRSARARGARRARRRRSAGSARPSPNRGRPGERRARRPRRRLHALQAGGELHRDVHGGGRRPGERHDRGAARRLRPRLRPRRQPRRAAEPDRGRHRADAQPRAARGSAVRRVARHERRLGDVSDSEDSPRRPRSR